MDEAGQGFGVGGRFEFQLCVTHELAGALQEAGKDRAVLRLERIQR